LHDSTGLVDAGAAYVYRRVASGWVEEAKLVPTDPDMGDEFGNAVALSGDTAVVGAWRDDTVNGVGTGSVYVFVRTGTTWSQQQKLVPSDVAPGDELGFSLAIDGDTIFAGARLDDAGGNDAGAVHVFERTGTSWARTQELLAPGPIADERFGSAVALEGTCGVVGGPSTDAGSGRLFVFEWAGASWGAGEALPQQPVGLTGALFGSSVALSGDILVAGAPQMFAPSCGVLGRVSVYVRLPNGWIRSGTLRGTESSDGHGFGASVDIVGDRLLVGAPGATFDGELGRGAVYVFEADGLWSQTLRTSAAQGGAGDGFGTAIAWVGDECLGTAPAANLVGAGAGAVTAQRLTGALIQVTEAHRLAPSAPATSFGHAVALSGNTLAAGAPGILNGLPSGPGTVQVFERSPTGWGGPVEIASGGSAGFGFSIAIEGDLLVAGDPLGPGSGAVYVFRRSGSAWTPEATLTAPDAAPLDFAGASVSMSGDTVVVGSTGDDGSSGDRHGSVNVYIRSGTSWSHQARLSPGTLAADPFFGTSTTIDGDTLLVGTQTSGAFVYRRSGTAWSIEATLTAGDGSPEFGFSQSVALDGSTAVLGHGNYTVDWEPGRGAVYVFERTGTAWDQSARIVEPRARNSGFGHRIAFDGDRLVVAGNLVNNIEEAVYVFRRDGGQWQPREVLQPSTPGVRSYGSSLAVLGNTVVVGAFEEGLPGPAPGAVYTYDLDATFPSFCDASDGSLALCPCGNPGVASSGCDVAQGTGGVELEVFGQQFGPENRATLVSSGYPGASTPSTVALRGSGLEPAGPVVFGDGLRCVANPLVRVRAAFAIGGTATHEIGHNASPGTHNYQLWFRNQPAPFCDQNAAFNLSNGRSLVW
jgi:hypothetical protein